MRTPQRMAVHGLALALSLCAACAHRPAAPPAVARGMPAEPVSVRLLTVNDFHGQLPAGKRLRGRPVGSAGVLAAWLAAGQAGAEDRTVVVHGGDLVGASPPASALLQDEPAVALMNRFANASCRNLAPPGASPVGAGRMSAEPDAADPRFDPWLDPRCNVVGVIGNHELDEGEAELLRLLGGGNHPRGPFLDDPWRGARYPTLAANAVDRTTGRPILPPYVVKQVGGVRVGFIGLVLRGVSGYVTPAGVAGLAFLDEAETANHYVEVLRRQGVRAVVVVVHQGGEEAPYAGPTREGGEVTGDIVDLVSRLDPEVDVVVAAHTHAFLNAWLPAVGGKRVLVVEAFSAGTAFGQIDLTVDPASGDVASASAAVQAAWADEGPGLTPDPAAAALQAAAEGRVAQLVERVVGVAAAPLSNAENAAGESRLGDLIADAHRAAFPDADIAFTNPGGIRGGLPAGALTWGQLFAVQPFGNELVAMTLTGAQVKALLEEQWAAEPRVLQVSGLSYAWSAAAPSGSKVSALRVGGAPLEPAARYRVVVNAFLAGGGDGFRAFTEGTERAAGGTDLEALVALLGSQPQPMSPPAGGRIRALP